MRKSERNGHLRKTMTLIQGSQPSLENPAENKHPGLTLFPNSLNKVNKKAPGKKGRSNSLFRSASRSREQGGGE